MISFDARRGATSLFPSFLRLLLVWGVIDIYIFINLYFFTKSGAHFFRVMFKKQPVLASDPEKGKSCDLEKQEFLADEKRKLNARINAAIIRLIDGADSIENFRAITTDFEMEKCRYDIITKAIEDAQDSRLSFAKTRAIVHRAHMELICKVIRYYEDPEVLNRRTSSPFRNAMKNRQELIRSFTEDIPAQIWG